MINPLAAQLLLPLTRTRMLQNLFDALEGCAPELRNLVAQFPEESGSICQQHRIHVSASGPGPRVLAVTLLKIKADCLMAVLQDITQQVEQERKLRQDETMFAALIAGVNDFALFSLDSQGRIDSWNRSGERQTGFSAADVHGRSLGVFSLPGAEVADNVDDQIEEAVREGWSLRDRWCARRDGSSYWCQMMVAADREIDLSAEDASGTTSVPAAPVEGGFLTTRQSRIAGFAVVLRDVTQKHVTAQELLRLLTTDHLTGADNRAHFFEVAGNEIARRGADGRPISALMIDIDYFKQINDCFGHATGDAMLQRLVTVCRSQLRGRDVIARMGGDEFAVLLPDTGLPGAIQIAERIRGAVASQGELPIGGCLMGGPPPIKGLAVSIGCATLTPSITGVDALLRAADVALYEAKRAGRDQAWAPPDEASATPSRRRDGERFVVTG